MSEKLIMQIKTGKSEVQLYRSGSAVRVHTFSSDGAADLTGKEALLWWNNLNKSMLKIFAAEKPPKTKIMRHKHGEYGRVLLSTAEYERLINDLGAEEAERCIACVDELAQEKNNKFKWHDWNLVVRKCHREQWHKKQIQEDTPHTSYDMGEFEERAAPLPVYRRKKETD